MHLHSLFWYGVILFLLSLYYTRILGNTWTVGLAILLFALDSAHCMPVVWLANRNSLIATCFGVGAMLLHDHWRKDGFTPGCILAPMLLGLSLLSAEFGIGTCAYLFAYVVFIDKKGTLSKVFSLLPYAIITLLWWTMYHLLGYGSTGSGTYIDPGHEPLRFLGAFVERLPILLHGQIGLFGANVYRFLPLKFSMIFWCITVVILTLLFMLLLPLLKSNNVARFWGLGMIVSLFPVTVGMPDGRLLLLAGIGGMGLLAQLFSAWFEKSAVYFQTPAFHIFRRIVVYLLIIVHLIIAPIYKVSGAQFYQGLRPIIDIPAADPILTPDHQHQVVIVLNTPGSFLFFHYTIVKIFNQHHHITPYRALANAESRLRILRRDERTLDIFAENGFYSDIFWDLHFRDPHLIMPIGHQVTTNGMNATVLSLTEHKRPQHVRFEFDHPLENSGYKFLYWNVDHYDRYQLPAIGQANYIEKFNFLDLGLE